MNDKTVGGVHWSFWAIGAVALIWNVMGIMNFFWQMTPDTLAAMPESQRAIIKGRPAWATGAFAIAVFGGALGCLLLLLRKSAAYYLFVASLLGVLVPPGEGDIHIVYTPRLFALGAVISAVASSVTLFTLLRSFSRRPAD